MKKQNLLLLVVFLVSILSCMEKKKTERRPAIKNTSKELVLSELIQSVPFHSVLKDPNNYIWGASMVEGEDQKYHLYYSTWPKSEGFAGWLDHSVIAYAVADSPGGPYKHKEVILEGFGKGHWNEQSAHNPHIKKFGNKYYLYFISHVNDDFGRESEKENHRWGQRIGVAVADTPNGPWVVSKSPLIEYQEEKGAEGYMVNPSVCQKPDGSYLMIFKTRSNNPELKNRMIQCTATSLNPDGPFIIAETPILTDKEAEDPFLWFQDGNYYAILDDQRGLYTGKHGLALFISKDGKDWRSAENPNVMIPEITWEDGSVSDLKYLERPQIWFNKNGKPAILFCAVQLKNSTDSINLPFNVHIPIKTN
ncbi:glycoside hydrolase family protein [Flavivirga spongiicola]|uniref:Glycoside hydrolase family protein n=1 Tax=Flavivirga spongiicola TaxID=421621 RepID=A0ABU7XQ97_9FLAO|nr:glycoside hydrolase family protein [Flavivirga sp. MEBiC05379]MDO5977920.1 glycoside hydrolase family protein [Flavivirga sp. MEBiC05379]